MKLELIPQSDEMKFQEWFDKHDGDLLCMECEDIARQSFMAGMQAAQQSMHPTPPTSRTDIALGVAEVILAKRRARKSAGG